jgi:hypothetical protein
MESLLKGMNEQLSPYIYFFLNYLFIYLFIYYYYYYFVSIYMHFGFFSRRQ